MTTLKQADRYGDLLAGLLDKQYTSSTRSVIGAILQTGESGAVANRLKQLDEEVARLAEAGEKLTEDNPVVRALLADFDDALARQAVLLDRAATGVIETGIDGAFKWVRQTSFPGFSDDDLISVGWNVPDPEAINARVEYADKPAWANELEKFQTDSLETVRGIAIRGIVDGRNPLAIARDLREAITGIPAHRANTMMRTLQLESYRSATAIHQKANADILQEQIRIAALDDRTCLCCIALHGKRYPLGEKIQDHHTGRCTSISVVKGRDRKIQSGEEWFNSLPEDRRLAIAGPGALEALDKREVRLDDFVQPYRDPVFGDMVRQSSLKGIKERKAARERQILESSTVEESRLDYPKFTEQTRGITLTGLEDGDVDPDDPIGGKFYEVFGYDENGNAVFDKTKVEAAHNDLMYRIYRIGRDNPTMADIEDTRQWSAVLLQAYDLGGIELTRKARNQLLRLAEGDIEAEMYNIKDNRAVGRSGGGSGRKRNRFQTSAEADGARRFFEERTKGMSAAELRDDGGIWDFVIGT